MHDNGNVDYTANNEGTFRAIYTASVTFQKGHNGQQFLCEAVFTRLGDPQTKLSPTIDVSVSCAL